ncbi:MAG: hypothetical protein JO097_12405 [Acidobacteriaceae bacterium]|nr:hypothetical protein [Acidobacteriaceae bacterium]
MRRLPREDDQQSFFFTLIAKSDAEQSNEPALNSTSSPVWTYLPTLRLVVENRVAGNLPRLSLKTNFFRIAVGSRAIRHLV